MSAQAAPAARPAMPTPDDAAWASSAAAPELAAAFVGGYKLSCHDDRLRARQHLVLIAADGSGSIDGVGVVDARHAGTVVLASDHRYFLQRDQGLQNGNSVPGDSLGLDFSAAADAAAAGAAAARNGIAIITNGSHIEYCTVVAGAPGADRFDITGLLRHLPQPYAVSCAIDTTTGYRWGAPRSFTVAANGDVMLAAGDYKRQAGDKVVSGGHWPATEYRTGSGYWRVEESRSFRATDARITPRYRLRISLGNAQDETLSVTYGAVVDANPDLEIGPVIGQAETIKASTCLSAQWLRREGLR